MVTSLALCFDAPMQSWGVRSRGVLRDTAMEPTKSGVVGVLAAASGTARDDEEQLAALAGLRLGIRVDREGLLERDYHTTQNVPTTLGTGHRTVVSERYYLADALFLVVLEGDEERLARLIGALDRPQWPLFFGRRAFPPCRPLLSGMWNAPVEDVLRDHDWLEMSGRARDIERAKENRLDLRTVVDCDPKETEAELRHDVPVSFAHGDRRFETRTVLVGHVPLTKKMIPAGDPLCS